MTRRSQDGGPQLTPEATAAIDAFSKAEAELNAFEEFLSSGKFMVEIFANCGGDVSRAQTEFQELWNRGRTLIEDYNAKLRSAKDALRQIVQLTPTQWRGPDGKATTVQGGGFNASSFTKRSFDAQSLLKLTQNHGLLERLLELKGMDKDGKPYSLVQQKWDIDYQGVLQWLRANKLDDVERGAYDETEGTPTVRGPKERYFFGDKKKD